MILRSILHIFIFICAMVTLLVQCTPESNPISGLESLTEYGNKESRPKLRTTFPASWDENWFSSPAVFDLDADGKPEIIASRHSVLYVWRNDGTLWWRAPVGENGSTADKHGKHHKSCDGRKNSNATSVPFTPSMHTLRQLLTNAYLKHIVSIWSKQVYFFFFPKLVVKCGNL